MERDRLAEAMEWVLFGVAVFLIVGFIATRLAEAGAL